MARRVSTAMISASVLGPIARSLALEAPSGFHSEYSRCAAPTACGRARCHAVGRHSAGRVPQHADRGGDTSTVRSVNRVLNLLADQGVRDGVEEPSDLDVIVDANPGKRPFGVLG